MAASPPTVEKRLRRIASPEPFWYVQGKAPSGMVLNRK